MPHDAERGVVRRGDGGTDPVDSLIGGPVEHRGDGLGRVPLAAPARLDVIPDLNDPVARRGVEADRADHPAAGRGGRVGRGTGPVHAGQADRDALLDDHRPGQPVGPARIDLELCRPQQEQAAEPLIEVGRHLRTELRGGPLEVALQRRPHRPDGERHELEPRRVDDRDHAVIIARDVVVPARTSSRDALRAGSSVPRSAAALSSVRIVPIAALSTAVGPKGRWPGFTAILIALHPPVHRPHA